MFSQGSYSTDQLRRNRNTVGNLALLGPVVAVILLVTGLPLPRVLGLLAIWLVFAGVTWWLFATKSSGPVDMPSNQRAWPYF